jgi:hypothetical protein
MDHDLIFAIAIAVWAPASMIWAGFSLARKWSKKRSSYKIKKARRALR